MSLHKTKFSRLNYIVEYNPVWILHSIYQLEKNVLLMMYINEDRGTIMVLIIKVNTLVACERGSWVQVFGWSNFLSFTRNCGIDTMMNELWLKLSSINRNRHTKKKQPQTQYLMRFSCNFRFNTRTFRTGKYKNR